VLPDNLHENYIHYHFHAVFTLMWVIGHMSNYDDHLLL